MANTVEPPASNLASRSWARLMAPLREWEVPPAVGLSRRALIIEVCIVLFLSLGKSAWYSVLKLVEFYTRPDAGNLADQKVSMTGVFSYDRVWLDWLLHLSDFVFTLGPVALVAWLLYNSRTPVQQVWFRARDRSRIFLASDLGRAVAMATLVGTLGIGLYLASNAFGFAATITAGDPEQNLRYWVFMLVDSLETSILEECVVVGYFLVRLRQLGVGPGRALVGAAAFRGSYHLYQGPWGLVGNFFMGLAFGYLYARWGRVTPLIVAHFIMDGVAFMALAFLAPHLAWLPS